MTNRPTAETLSLLFAVALLIAVGARTTHAQSFRRGDANTDANIDISDGVGILQFLFNGAASPDCIDAADTNDTGALDLSDAAYLFNFLFLGGAAPPAPFPDCGIDPSEDSLPCVSHAPCDSLPEEPRRNILLIISDDIGVESSPCYSPHADLPSTPTLDALCANGVVFDHVWSAPICTPTRATIITGRYAFRTGVGYLAQNGDPALSLDELTIPEALDANPQLGYAHAAIGKWHLGSRATGGRQNPTLTGFSHFSGSIGGGVNDYSAWSKTVDGRRTNSTAYATTDNVDDALDWIGDRDADEPWFLWLAFNAPHTPLHLPPAHLHSNGALSGTDEDIEANPRAYFLAMVEAMDREIGRLLATLPEDVRENTDVIYVGDNGAQRNVTLPPSRRREAKDSLYQGGIHVPLIVAGPSVVDGGRRVCDLVNPTDLFATILELAGVDLASTLPDGTKIDSHSLVPHLKNLELPAHPNPRHYALAELFGESVPGARAGKTIRNDRYKLIRFDTGTDELYDLLRDPDEDDDLLTPANPSAEARAAFEELSMALEALLAS